MEKRTILAIVLSLALVFGSVYVQSVFFPNTPAPSVPAQTVTTPEKQQESVVATPQETPLAILSIPTVAPEIGQTELLDLDAPTQEKTYTVSTEVVDAVFTNKGGELVSYKMKKHLKDGIPVEMILGGSNGSDAFALSLSDRNGPVLTDFMKVFQPNPLTIEFSRTYYTVKQDKTLVPFVIRKKFSFKQDEYMFKLSVMVENSVNEYPALNTNGVAYTLSFGPQIGPDFLKLDNTYEYRKYYYRSNAKRNQLSPAVNAIVDIKDRASWAGIISKYFAFIAVPDATDYRISYSTVPVQGLAATSLMYIQRPVIKSAKSTDEYHFYLGPKTPDQLGRYNDETKNSFNFRDIRIDDSIDYDMILGWLEAIMKIILKAFYAIIPNWGVSIIFLTLLVKIVTFPLTHKGSEASARMQELQPKMQELQTKYKNNPQKLNAEMAEFYKKEGYNPLSGCLPILIQIPLFFAMYNLFNNHFDLRGASFIPGWISDLSQPEAIFKFAEVNFVVWKVSAIRLLPVLYVASQLVYGKFTQQPGQQQNQQMKIMMYGMPIFFFFILYDAPSGLLVYWIASNLLTIIQQVVIMRMIKAKKKKA